MKAILTEYRGITYRSRIEARWAVAFELLGLGVVYEPEGLDMGNGRRYLPDFATTYDNLLIAIKPMHDLQAMTAAWKREIEWQEDFYACGTPMFIIAGVPCPNQYVILLPQDTARYQFYDCRKCEGLCFSDGGGNWGKIGIHSCRGTEREPTSRTRVRAAMLAAMSERFGERASKKARGETP
jgi:hypothetical protein